LVDLVGEPELLGLERSVRGVIAACVTAMPTHEQFIERCCKAPAAA
jgi:tryptophan halogenase